jgi:ribosomal protein L12E/L44/L45/RPP1/RPP2
MSTDNRSIDEILREINARDDAKAADAATATKPEPARNERGQFTEQKDWSNASKADIREKLAEYGVNSW